LPRGTILENNDPDVEEKAGIEMARWLWSLAIRILDGFFKGTG
jgi:hypothetical protein